MSRCFPFPPPGYEDTARAHGLASLPEKKHKEKKHKKDKEKKERKERKDKEKNKDKHKDKKDQKERLKDKDKNKDKSRESQEGTEKHGEADHEQKSGANSRKSEENKYYKFKEELVRAYDEKGAANRSVENTVSTQRSHESIGSAPTMEHARTAVNKMHINTINAARNNGGLGQQTNITTQQNNGTTTRHSEKFTGSAQRTHEGFSAAAAMDKERIKVSRVHPNSTVFTPKKEGMPQQTINRNLLAPKRSESPSSDIAKKEVGVSSPFLARPVHAAQKGYDKAGRPMDIPTSVQSFDCLSTSSAAAGMDRGRSWPTNSSPSITIQRPNGMVLPLESLSISTQKKQGAAGFSAAMGRENDQGGRMLQNNTSTDHKTINNSSVEKIDGGRAERMEKVRDGAPDEARKEKDKKSDRHEKKKRKDKDKYKENKKEKEIIKEKDEHNHREYDKLIENSINYQIDSFHMEPQSLTSLLPVHDADENFKKRMNHETNGYIQNHHHLRPTKLPRTTVPNNLVENGMASHVDMPLLIVKPDAVNIVKTERLLAKKEDKINGNRDAQQSSADSGLPDPVAVNNQGMTTKKLPHPDSKYLSQIYAIPEIPLMMEWFEPDGHGWLFDRSSLQSKVPKSESEADEAPQVWAQALKVDSADVIALPYVIPF